MMIDGRLADLADPIDKDAAVKIVTRTDPEALELIRHDAAHVMAEAVQALWPGTQVTIGPVIENGFFYDFAKEEPFHPDDLAQDRGQDARDHRSQRALHQGVLEPAAGQGLLQEEGRAVQDRAGRRHPRGRGPQDLQAGRMARPVPRPAHDLDRADRQGLQAHPLRRLLLARQFAKGPSCSASTAPPGRRDAELATYLKQLEEAEKRDHRKLGREMDLFHFQEEGPGVVFWHPKGWELFQSLINYMRRRQNAVGYREVNGPQILDKSLWETSGHWETFRENMFTTVTEDEREFAIKPMNCPGHIQIFKHGLRSYRELPYRVAEFGIVHRYEPSGALHGLMRVRGFTQDDAHVFCTEAQLADECLKINDLILSIYRDFGFEEVVVKLSTRPEKRVGADAAVGPGRSRHVGGAEADRGAIRRQDQDRHQPGRGRLLRPQVRVRAARCHRPRLAVRHHPGRLQPAGAVRRLLHRRRRREEDAGHDPPRHLRLAWSASPASCSRIPPGICRCGWRPCRRRCAPSCRMRTPTPRRCWRPCRRPGLRAEIDLRNEKINYKVREHSLAKVPVMLVVGKREAEEKTVSRAPPGRPAAAGDAARRGRGAADWRGGAAGSAAGVDGGCRVVAAHACACLNGVILGLVPRIQCAANSGVRGCMDGRDTRNQSECKQARP